MNFYAHPLADVQNKNIGENTKIWQFVVILPGAKIGSDVDICSHCLIENDVVVGNRVTVKSGVQLPNGLRIGDDVFIGPNVAFTNDKFPRSKEVRNGTLHTEIGSGASLGAGTTILPGLKIGRNAIVGAGAVVTRSVPMNAIVAGNPARIMGYVDADREMENDLPTAQISETNTPRISRVEGVSLIELPRITDIRGSLTVGEFDRSIPFEAKRYFVVFDVPSVETRGEHAHRECHEVLICVRGKLSVVADDGRNRQEFLLSRPDFGLHLPPMVWRIQYKFSADAVLLVLASHYYDNADYIRDYSDFLLELEKN